MPPIFSKYKYWIVSALVVLIVLAPVGSAYSKVRSLDNMLLVPLTISDRFGSVTRYLADLELDRRIRAGQADGPDVLVTMLSLAYSGGFDQSIVEEKTDELLASGVDVNSHSSFGFTPLHRALSLNDPLMVEYLLSRCADPGTPTVLARHGTEQMDAIEFAFFLEKEWPDKNFSPVISVLQRKHQTVHCNSVANDR